MTNRDHSPSISQNDGGDAKLRTEGSGVDLDALEAVARAATQGEWRQGKIGDPLSGEHCVDFGRPPKAPFMVLLGGHPGSGDMCPIPASGVVHSDDGSSAANARHIATFDPPTCLAMIQTQRELVAALSEARELLLERTQGSPARSAGHNARLVIEAAIAKAGGRS